MIKELIGSIVCLLSFKYTDSKWLPNTKPTTAQHQEIYVPEALRSAPIEHLVVPSKTFCSDMYLKSFGQEIIMPWWHHICEGMRERKEKRKNEFYNRYGWVLDTLNLYRRSGGPLPEREISRIVRNKKL